MQHVIGGDLLNMIAENEAHEQILGRSADQMKDIQCRVETTEIDDTVIVDTVNQQQEIEIHQDD